MPIPSGIVNLKKLTINRSTGVWSDHDMRLDVTDVVSPDTFVLVLTSGILMMNTSSNGAGTVKTLFMDDVDVEQMITATDANHVDGYVSRAVNNDDRWHNFPIGNKGKCRKVALRSTSMTSGNINTARLIYSAHPDYLDFNPATLPGGVTNKYWWEQNKGSAANNAKRFYYETSDFPAGVDLNDITIASYTGTTWTASTTPTTINTSLKYIEQNSVNASNDIPWSWGSENASLPLPINLFNVSSRIINDRNVLVSWSAGGNLKNANFTVERSRNLSEFENMGNVYSSTKNLTGFEDFQYIDYEPYHGISYYRLKYYEKSGTENYSDPLVIFMELKKMEVLKIFPNPVSGFTYLNIYTEETQPAVIQVINNVGQIVKESKINLSSGTSVQEVDMNELGSGIYFMKVIPSGEKAQTGKVVKK
ncbi:MAG: hypothetical protein A3H98_14720 [Bacteroidetes bacterium RIFCSPLOWO2_02_FULL_36_8]|nr:MAG: hypothetical protein A3H98_14720 [Bacteroidetes bacterium RIFCSPLOWO2_02_FULL_36_8]